MIFTFLFVKTLKNTYDVFCLNKAYLYSIFHIGTAAQSVYKKEIRCTQWEHQNHVFNVGTLYNVSKVCIHWQQKPGFKSSCPNDFISFSNCSSMGLSMLILLICYENSEHLIHNNVIPQQKSTFQCIVGCGRRELCISVFSLCLQLRRFPCCWSIAL